MDQSESQLVHCALLVLCIVEVGQLLGRVVAVVTVLVSIVGAHQQGMRHFNEPRLEHQYPLCVDEHPVVDSLCSQCVRLPHLVFDLL